MPTIFERYGGFAKVSAIVSAFYDNCLDSPVLAPYFRGVDMTRLMVHQSKFMAQAMGGPATVSDRELQRAHARLRVTEAAFDEMLAVLRRTLEDGELDAEEVGFVCGQVVARKPLIVNTRY